MSAEDTTKGEGGRRSAKSRKKKAPEKEEAKGPDRVLRFADEMASREVEEEEVERELETWVTCHVEREIFALPVRQIQEILRVDKLTRVPHAPFPVRGVTNMRGHVLPVVDLRRRLGLDEAEIGRASRILVIDSKGRLIGLMVDAVQEVTEIDRLRVEDPPDDVMTDQSYYIQGVYHRGEDLFILLDADRVLEIRDGDQPAESGGQPKGDEA